MLRPLILSNQIIRAYSAKRVLLWQLAFWASALFVAYGSLVPGDTLPPISTNDKLLHLVGHGGVAFCGALAYPRHWRYLLLGLPVFGAGLEVLQQWVPNRSFDWLDMVANVSGIGLAFVLMLFWRRFVGEPEAKAN